MKTSAPRRIRMVRRNRQAPRRGADWMKSDMAVYTLPDLPYDFAALEPHISGKIMELHHDKHHADIRCRRERGS